MLNEDEIQVGEFIRTKYGDIGKVRNKAGGYKWQFA